VNFLAEQALPLCGVLWSSSAGPLSDLNCDRTLPAATFKIDGYRTKAAERN